MNSIIQESKKYLLQLINTLENLIKISFNDINNLCIWNILILSCNYTFIDIIKGIFSTNLTLFIQRSVRNRSLSFDICLNFRNFVYEKTQPFWKERCDLQQYFEKNIVEIRKSDKIQLRNVYTGIHNITHSLSSSSKNLINYNLLRNSIYFGGKLLDYVNEECPR